MKTYEVAIPKLRVFVQDPLNRNLVVQGNSFLLKGEKISGTIIKKKFIARDGREIKNDFLTNRRHTTFVNIKGLKLISNYSAEGDVIIDPNSKLANLPKTIGRYMQISSLIGLFGGLIFAYYRKSGIGGYIGWGILGGVSGSVVGGGILAIKAKRGLNKIEKSLDKTVGGAVPPPTGGNLNDKLYELMKNFSASTLNMDKKPLPTKDVFEKKINTLSNNDKQIAFEIGQAMDELRIKFANKKMDENAIMELMATMESVMKKLAAKYGEDNVKRVNDFMATV